ncbi:MAG: RNA 2',3'-cyclic phosphodiesterase [Hyphomicrobiaceae bacterium]|nr:RNA 2',3'-cyclic phosphodiesterase [Hyphomicrobiaceae bacterium]
MPRLFTGLEIPEDIRDQLSDLSMPLPGAWWIDSDELHVTLRFAGDVDNPTADDFVRALDAINEEAFVARLAGLGTFGAKDPRSIWVGVEAGPALARLAKANERAARAAGLPPETRAFKAHVTIARLRNSPPQAIARMLARRSGYRSEPFLVTNFALFSSKPVTGGGPYIVEETFPLTGGGAPAGNQASLG